MARITRRDCIEPRLARGLEELESRWQPTQMAVDGPRELSGHAKVGAAAAGWLLAALSCLALCGVLRSRSFPALHAQFRAFRDKDPSCSA